MNLNDINFMEQYNNLNKRKPMDILFPALAFFLVLFVIVQYMLTNSDIERLTQENAAIQTNIDNQDTYIISLQEELNVVGDTVVVDLEAEFLAKVDELDKIPNINHKFLEQLRDSNPIGVFFSTVVITDNMFTITGYATNTNLIALLQDNVSKLDTVKEVHMPATTSNNGNYYFTLNGYLED